MSSKADNPSSFKIIVDSREKNPWSFSTGSLVEDVIVKKLDAGDYSVEGLESSIFIERKASVDELFVTLGINWDRFEAELERAKNYSHKYLILEMNLRDIFRGSKYSKMSGSFIVARLISLSIKYGVSVIYAGNGEHCPRFVVSLLKQILKSCQS